MVLADAATELGRLRKILVDYAERLKTEGIPTDDIEKETSTEVFIMPKEGTPEREAAVMLERFANTLYETEAAEYLLYLWRSRRITDNMRKAQSRDTQIKKIMAGQPATNWKN